MAARKFISIDEEKCNGCAECIIACAEGALKIVDGKAKVIGENLCDGLGACIGHCPMNALTIVERDVVEFDEHAVEKYLRDSVTAPCCPSMSFSPQSSCPSAMAKNVTPATIDSDLTNWPLQLALANPPADCFKGTTLLVAADCCAFAYGNFHHDFLSGKTVVIFCPKLDNMGTQYTSKLATIIAEGKPKAIETVHMEVPCCSGLVQIVRTAISAANVLVGFKETVIGVKGDIK